MKNNGIDYFVIFLFLRFNFIKITMYVNNSLRLIKSLVTRLNLINTNK